MEFIGEESEEEEEERGEEESEEEGEERVQMADDENEGADEEEETKDPADSDIFAEEESEDLSRIKFSKEKDLERYRASRRREAPADNADSRNGHAKDTPSYERTDFAEDEEPSPDSDKRTLSSLFEFSIDKSTLLAVPAAMFIALIALLVLTFYSEIIPEFTGALASAMLIITLIIYGAATLLKA